MKRIITLSLLIVFASLFAACKKEDNTAPYSTNLQTAINYSSAIDYSITTKLSQPGGLFNWTEGYINANELIFNAIHSTGNPLARQIFETPVQHLVSISNGAELGLVHLPAIACNSASFTIELGTRAGYHALALGGTFYGINPTSAALLPGHLIPVELLIDDVVNLNSVWLGNVLINKAAYSALIEFSLDNLTTGITYDMMAGATMTDGGIIIANNSNQNLYNIIINNLQGNIMNVQFAEQQVTAQSAPNATN